MADYRCVYCLQPKDVYGREHVIPQSLGMFSAKRNLVLSTVCAECNNLFSKLETVFKEDSYEGLLAAQYQVKSTSSARFRKDLCQVHFEFGEDPIFDRLIPVFSLDSEGARPTEQLVIEGADGRTLVVWAGGLEKKDLKDKIQWCGKKVRVYIFAADSERKNYLIEQLRGHGVQFELGNTAELHSSVSSIDSKVDARINRSLRRVIAKIAFNYFAYCLNESGLAEFLYNKNFDFIRRYSLSEDIDYELVSVDGNSMTNTQFQDQPHFPYHFVGIEEELGGIMGTVSLFGHLRYKVKLGEPLFHSLDRGTLAVRHVFDLRMRSYQRAHFETDCIGPHGEFFPLCSTCPSYMMDLKSDWIKLGQPALNYRALTGEEFLVHLRGLVQMNSARVQDAAAAQNLSMRPAFFVSMIGLKDNKVIFEEAKSSMKWAVPLS